MARVVLFPAAVHLEPRQFWLPQSGWHHMHCPRQPYISRSYLLLSHSGLSEQPSKGLSERSPYVLGPGHILFPAFISQAQPHLKACHSKCLLAPKPAGYSSFLLYLSHSLPVWFVGLIPLPIPHPQTPLPTKPRPANTVLFISSLPLVPLSLDRAFRSVKL